MIRSISWLIIGIVTTGCVRFGDIPTPTNPLETSALSVNHSFKSLKKSPALPYFKHLNDPQLTHLIVIGLADAPDMRRARARVVRARALAEMSYAGLFPTLSLNGDVAKAYFPIRGTIPPQFPNLKKLKQANLANIGLRFNYELDFWGKNREHLASKINEADAAQMDLAEARLLLASAIANTYFDVQNNMNQQRLAKENAHLLRELADITLDRAKQGIQSNIPVNTAVANAQAARLAVEDYKRQEQQSRFQLAVLMGKNPMATTIEVATFSKKQLPLPSVIPANLLAQRPDIAAACLLAEAAAHQIRVAKTAFFPNVNLRGLLSLQSFFFNKAFNIWLQNDNIAAALDLPIFDAGSRRANLHANYAQYEIAVNQYNKTILNALKEVGNQLTALDTLKTQIAAQESVLKSTAANYNLYQAQYTHGIIDDMQLIDIKQLLVQQKAILRQLQTRQIQAYVSLLTALGGDHHG